MSFVNISVQKKLKRLIETGKASIFIPVCTQDLTSRVCLMFRRINLHHSIIIYVSVVGVYTALKIIA